MAVTALKPLAKKNAWSSSASTIFASGLNPNRPSSYSTWPAQALVAEPFAQPALVEPGVLREFVAVDRADVGQGPVQAQPVAERRQGAVETRRHLAGDAEEELLQPLPVDSARLAHVRVPLALTW